MYMHTNQRECVFRREDRSTYEDTGNTYNIVCMYVSTYIRTYVYLPSFSYSNLSPSPVRVVRSIWKCRLQSAEDFCIPKIVTKNLSILLRCGFGGEGGGASCREELGAVETG
jgi:hypothetical protein